MTDRECDGDPDGHCSVKLSDLLVRQSLQAATASIEIFNKPNFPYRHEVFSILITNAWELLLKAKVIRENSEDVESVFVVDKKKHGPKTYKAGMSGNPTTHGLVHLAGKIQSIAGYGMEKSCKDNIFALYAFRNDAVHFISNRHAIARRITELGAASVRNYALLVKEWFGKGFIEETSAFLPLVFASSTDFTVLSPLTDNEFARRLVEQWDRLAQEHENRGSKQPFTIGMELTVRRTRDLDSPAVRWTHDPEAPGVNLKEEDISGRYPWTYQQLTDRLRDRYSDFLIKDDYHRIRKAVEDDPQYCWTRRLDPKNPKSLVKRFYSQAIIGLFDQHYTKK